MKAADATTRPTLLRNLEWPGIEEISELKKVLFIRGPWGEVKTRKVLGEGGLPTQTREPPAGG